MRRLPLVVLLLLVRPAAAQERKYLLERVDDVAVVQLYADGFEDLSPRQKILVYHLYQAALAGRDIFLQQKCALGLTLRDFLEELLVHGEKVPAPVMREIRRYLKLFWINNGPYNALTNRKNLLRLRREELLRAADTAAAQGARFPTEPGETTAQLVDRLAPTLFDPEYEPMVTVKNPTRGGDIITESAVTFYGKGVTLRDLEGFREHYVLNSTVVKRPDGRLEEIPWRSGDFARGIPGGLYAEPIARIVTHLERALPYAPPPTRAALRWLIRWYRTGEPEDFRRYNIAWVADQHSPVDTINGFIEVYFDPRGKKGSWEGIVFYEDPKKAALIQKLAEAAQWFEDHMPYDDAFKKPKVKGISARAINVVIETGDSGPVTPIGINLPNDAEIREHYGSKSVSLSNVIEAYNRSSSPAARREFCWCEEEVARAEKWGALVEDLLTNMHEVIGHASGRQAPDKRGDPATWIKEYYSALEEARADLVALYFIMDPKLKELGLVDDPEEAALAAYEAYTRNGAMLQLRRIKHGDQIEEDHMRNRQMIVRWILAHGNAIEERVRDGKHYFVVRDARAWRAAAGRLLRLVQRLKSTGDYEGTKKLFDAYGIKFDPRLRDEVVARYAKLNVPAYTAFVMPRLTALYGSDGRIRDVRVSYPLSLEQQMLEWSGRRHPPEH